MSFLSQLADSFFLSVEGGFAFADPSRCANLLLFYRMKSTEEKTENAAQYSQYVQETKPLREELGILLKEELYTK